MRLLSLCLPLLAIAASAGQAEDRDRGPGIPGERRGDTIVYRVANFDAVGIGTAGIADVRVGPAWSLRIEGPEAALRTLRVTNERGRLNIGRRWSDRNDGDAERRLRIFVTLPRLKQAALGGSGRVAIDRVAGDGFEAAVGGSGTMAIGRLDVARATVSIGGSGEVSASGRARDLTVNVGGSGDLRAPGLVASSATIAAAGSGNIRASVDGPATVSLVGSGDVDLGPRARCRVTRMGSGRVSCGR